MEGNKGKRGVLFKIAAARLLVCMALQEPLLYEMNVFFLHIHGMGF